MGRPYPGALLPPRPPGRPAAVALAAGRSPRWSAVARQSGCPLRGPTRSSPAATAPPAAGRAPTHCSSAPRPPRGQRSTAQATTSGAAGTVPPPSGPGYPDRAAAGAPAEPGAVSAGGATLGGRTLLPRNGAIRRTAARFQPAPSARSVPLRRRGPPAPGSRVAGGCGTAPAARPETSPGVPTVLPAPLRAQSQPGSAPGRRPSRLAHSRHCGHPSIVTPASPRRLTGWRVRPARHAVGRQGHTARVYSPRSLVRLLGARRARPTGPGRGVPAYGRDSEPAGNCRVACGAIGPAPPWCASHGYRRPPPPCGSHGSADTLPTSVLTRTAST
jgi:hypothetical protein